MTVLVKDRKPSKMQYVTNAGDIFIDLSRLIASLPKRLNNTRTVYFSDTAYSIVSNTISANCIYVKSDVDFNKRREYLLEARVSCVVLLNLIDSLLREDPKRVKIVKDEVGNSSFRKISYINGKHALDLIKKINEEIKLLNGVMSSDAKAFNNEKLK